MVRAVGARGFLRFRPKWAEIGVSSFFADTERLRPRRGGRANYYSRRSSSGESSLTRRTRECLAAEGASGHKGAVPGEHVVLAILGQVLGKPADTDQRQQSRRGQPALDGRQSARDSSAGSGKACTSGTDSGGSNWEQRQKTVSGPLSERDGTG
jgi:hypothetical protein